MDRETIAAPCMRIRPIGAAGEALAIAVDRACEGLARDRPKDCAKHTLTSAQAIAIIAFLAILITAMMIAPGWTAAIGYGLAWLAFAAAIIVRAAAAIASLLPPPPPPAFKGPPPRYSLLVPLHREAKVATDLIAALSRLHYPKERLEILLLLEADDAETIAAIAAAMPAGPSPFRMLLIPPALPRTKPKALNFALEVCSGEVIGVYDAEDRPHPDQLSAALAALQAGGAAMACVQAPLLTDNAKDSWLAAQFRAEYAILFTQLVPFLARFGLPLPLGGTSNHFRRSALIAVGGWDPYNVTEDADLGYRLARAGYRIGAITPPTFEEAPTHLPAWLRQRSRWIKGHLQTWLVQMRSPAACWNDLGALGFAVMNLILAGGIVAAFLHAPFPLGLTIAALTPGLGVGPLDWTLAASGYAVAFTCALCAAFVRRDHRIALTALTMPLYWPLAFFAALMAVMDLILRPHYWAKTDHAVAARSPPTALAEHV